LEKFRELRAELSEHRLLPEPAHELLGDYRRHGKQLGLKPAEILMPLRNGAHGSEHGPELKYVLAILDRDDVLGRLDRALGASPTTAVETEGDLA